MSQERLPKPEDHELELKRQELAVLDSGLAERELELATLQKELHAFETRSKAELDPRYEELATLQQRIGELQHRLEPVTKQPAAKDENQPPAPPKTPEVPRKKRARPEFPEKPPRGAARKTNQISPAQTLKRLYRDVAKAVHPDMADDDLERQHRHALMVKANEAYDAGDELKLSAILHEWESSPEAIRGHGTIPDLVRTIRKIHRCKLRLAYIAVEIKRLTATSLYSLKNMADAAQNFERDLLSEMTERLDQQIADAKRKLAQLEKTAAALPPVAEYEPMYVQTFAAEGTRTESQS